MRPGREGPFCILNSAGCPNLVVRVPATPPGKLQLKVFFGAIKNNYAVRNCSTGMLTSLLYYFMLKVGRSKILKRDVPQFVGFYNREFNNFLEG